MADFDIDCRADDPRLARLLDDWLAHFAPGSEPVARGRFSFDWRVVAPGEIPPAEGASRTLVDYYYVTGTIEAGRTVFRGEDGSWLALDADADRVEARIPRPALDGPPWIVRDLFSAALTALFRRHGRFPIHAAALANDPQGVLVVGPPMAGKTTLALNFLRRGWGWVSDDKVALEAAGGTVRAAGLFRQSNIDPRLRRWFAELDDLERLPAAHPHSDKRAVRIESYYGRVAAPGVVPTHLLFPRVLDTGPTRVEPLDREEAFLALLHQSPVVNDRGQAARQLELLGRLARVARGFRILAGRDLLEDPGCLERLGPAMELTIGPPVAGGRPPAHGSPPTGGPRLP